MIKAVVWIWGVSVVVDELARSRSRRRADRLIGQAWRSGYSAGANEGARLAAQESRGGWRR